MAMGRTVEVLCDWRLFHPFTICTVPHFTDVFWHQDRRPATFRSSFHIGSYCYGFYALRAPTDTEGVDR